MRKLIKAHQFYWLGIAAFMVHDYQTATFFFDAAVSEDLRAGVDPEKSLTPALCFVRIDSDNPNQAAKQLVEKMQIQIKRAIADYNELSGKSSSVMKLDLSQIQESFLRPAVSPCRENGRILATAFLSYFLEWEYRNTLIELRAGKGTAEPFFIHLFKGCLLFESLLKENPTVDMKLKKTLGEILNDGSIKDKLSISGAISISNVDFPKMLGDLTPGIVSIEKAIEFTGRTRNIIGHNLGWKTTLEKSQYEKLAKMIACSCLHAIACLYQSDSPLAKCAGR